MQTQPVGGITWYKANIQLRRCHPPSHRSYYRPGTSSGKQVCLLRRVAVSSFSTALPPGENLVVIRASDAVDDSGRRKIVSKSIRCEILLPVIIVVVLRVVRLFGGGEGCWRGAIFRR